MDIDSVRNALQDCYGLFLNTDSFTVKEGDEIWAAIRIFEISNRIPTLRHFVWSGIDYALKKSGFNPRYGAYHVNAKGRVNEYLENQPSSKTEDGLAWTILNTAAYNEMLAGGLFMPQIQPDGTRVFAFPLGSGRLPLIALDDIGTFARLIFDSRATFSGATLGAVSHFATGTEVAETTARVAGVKAVYMPVTYEQWVSAHPLRDLPFAKTDPTGPTFAQGFKMLWATFEDRLMDTYRDVDGLKALHPGLRTLEGWMRDTGYDGTPVPFLKGSIELMAELGRA
jgi:NmrA-like family